MKDISNSIPHEDQLMRNKLILLYFIKQMELPLTETQISEFTINENYMDYFMFKECLEDLIEAKYITSFKNEDTNTSSITATKDGLDALKYLSNQLAPHTKKNIDDFLLINKGRLRSKHEITANYFYDDTSGEYLVKCGLFEVDKILMEISVSVVNKETARLVCNNWPENVKTLYGDVLNKLLESNGNSKKVE